MSDGRQFGEAVLVVAAVAAVLLSAAFLPVVDVFGDGGGLGEFSIPGGGGSGGGVGGEVPGGTSGSDRKSVV